MHARITLTLLPALLALAAPAARADRYQRGQQLFQTECVRCHSLSWQAAGPAEKGRIDLTRVIDRRDDRALVRWLSSPQREKPGVDCRVPEWLTPLQVGDLLHFFHAHAGAPPAQPKPLPASANTRNPRYVVKPVKGAAKGAAKGAGR
jgi:hypothetical protein